MKRIAIVFLGALLLNCAGVNRESMHHRKIAREKAIAGNTVSAFAHYDTSAWVCEDDLCMRESYEDMLETSYLTGNEVMRAKAYEKIALTYFDEYFNLVKLNPEIARDKFDSARRIANEYLYWADSLNKSRGDPFPMVDALLLTSKIAVIDSPLTALNNLSIIIDLEKRVTDPQVLEMLTFKVEAANKMVNFVGQEMAARLKSGEENIKTDNSQSAVDDLIYVYYAAVGFGNTDIAIKAVNLLVEYFKTTENSQLAAEWTGVLLRLQGEKETKQQE